MKFYIVDDILSIVKVLTRIIYQKNLGDVIGYSTDAETAEKEIISMNPDIVLVDLLMPVKDGTTIVHNVKEVCPNISFIMISQVSDKGMIASAYNEGIEFFISKPINIIEVENVIGKVTEKIVMTNMLGGIRQMFQVDSLSSKKTDGMPRTSPQKIKEIKYVLNLLGILGEKGSKDILEICETLIDRNLNYNKKTIQEYSDRIQEDSRMVKQRIRRAVKKGLTNTAAMGIEDYYSEIFQTYSYMFFNFESIKTEMDFLRKKSNISGKASIDKFLEGMMTYSETKE